MTTADRWADWLVHAVARATRDRRLLRGAPEEDKILTGAIFHNARQAIVLALQERGVQEPDIQWTADQPQPSDNINSALPPTSTSTTKRWPWSAWVAARRQRH